jgi:flagellar biosynthesis GTPase FlhF
MAAKHLQQYREKHSVRRPAASAETTDGMPQSGHPLLNLQRQVGNAQIARMLAQREDMEEEELMQAARDPELQRQPVEEEEEELMQAARDPELQRQAADEEEEELMQAARDPAVQREELEDEELQMSRAAPEVGREGGPVSDATAGRIERMRGGGSALDEGMRREMEGTLGADLSDVRVHTGSEAAQLNRSLGAQAFTTGSDVFFGSDSGARDKGLLAHELTHVVQQRGMRGSGDLTVGPADDGYEQEAETTAAQVRAGAQTRRKDD